MRAILNKKSISVSGTMNESLYEQLNNMVEEAKAKVVFRSQLTKATITGTDSQLNQFIGIWNK